MNINYQHKKILIAPLDWGLGHATRCIALIHHLQKLNCEIIVAADGKIKHLLQNEFPSLVFTDLPGYNISYSKSKRLLPFKILIQIPKILKIIRLENKWVNKIVKEGEINAIISDNRFGLCSKNVKSIFITHQLSIKTNFYLLDKVLQRINYKYINKFSECWVPDLNGEINIAGVLSHPAILPAIPVKYLGPLSRFRERINDVMIYKWMVIISGPEPQRSIFEKKILEVASKMGDSFLIVRGLPGEEGIDIKLPNCKIFNHLNTNDMQAAIESSEFIVSRCGYTTVMEVLSLQKKSVFIPTPGQTEQEYLANHLLKQNWSYTFQQQSDFGSNFLRAKSFKYKLPEINTQQYKIVLETFVSTLE